MCSLERARADVLGKCHAKSRQRSSKTLQQFRSVLRSNGAALLELNDMATYLPACSDLDCIDGSESLLPSTIDQFSETDKQTICRLGALARII